MWNKLHKIVVQKEQNTCTHARARLTLLARIRYTIEIVSDLRGSAIHWEYLRESSETQAIAYYTHVTINIASA